MVNQAELARIVWFRPRPKLSLRVVNDVRSASTKEVVDLGGKGLEVAQAAISASRRRRRGRRPGDAIEIAFGGLPDCDGNDAWPDTRVRSWADASVNWARRLVGSESVIVAAALHLYRPSPSTRVLAVPIVGGELGWTRVRDCAVESFTAAFGIHSPTRYAALANTYILEVGSAFGLGSVDLEAQASAARDYRAQTYQAREDAAKHRAALALKVAEDIETRLAAARSNRDALANATYYRKRMGALENELALVKGRAEETQRRYRVMISAEDKLRTEHQKALDAAVSRARMEQHQATVVGLIDLMRKHEQRAGRTFAPELAAVLDACVERRSHVPLSPPDDG